MVRVFFRHCEAAEDWLESTEAEQLSPEEILKVASEIKKIIVAQDKTNKHLDGIQEWKIMNGPLADDDGQSLFSALWSCWGLTGVDWSWTAEPWRDREGCKWNRENHSCPGCMMNTRTQVYTVCYLSILRLVLLLYLHNWPYYYVVLYVCK